MIHFGKRGNSLKKNLAGAFGVVTMLTPLQNAQCFIYAGEEHQYYKQVVGKTPTVSDLSSTCEVDTTKGNVAKLNLLLDTMCERTYNLLRDLPKILSSGRNSQTYSKALREWKDISDTTRDMPYVAGRDLLYDIVNIELARIDGSDFYKPLEDLLVYKSEKPKQLPHDELYKSKFFEPWQELIACKSDEPKQQSLDNFDDLVKFCARSLCPFLSQESWVESFKDSKERSIMKEKCHG